MYVKFKNGYQGKNDITGTLENYILVKTSKEFNIIGDDIPSLWQQLYTL